MIFSSSAFKTSRDPSRIAIFGRTMRSGGVERVTLHLANEMVARGLRVDLVLAECKGPYLEQLDSRVHLVDLKALEFRRYTLALCRYLKDSQPDAILAQGSECGVAAVLARFFARTPTRVVASCHGTLSRAVANTQEFKVRFLPMLMRYTFPMADAVVAVSKGVADDLSSTLNLSRRKIDVIYNPSVTPELLAYKGATPSHRFWKANAPVVVAVGRMVLAKNFPCLLNAFSKVVATEDVRLLILGDGPERERLERQVEQLGIFEYVDLPGFVDPPWSFMAASSVFVLSSSWEGLPTVLIEALALGCTIVSTDCPSGPREILENGRHGDLVPPEDPEKLAEAIVGALSKKANPLLQKERAQIFMAARSVDAYLLLLLGEGEANNYRSLDSDATGNQYESR